MIIISNFNVEISLSGCAATIFPYLSEFHDKQHRARAIMGASIIYAVCMAMAPLLAWAVINQEFSFHIPFIDIIYKPWRLYIVTGSSFGFLSFLILSFLPESPKFLLSQGKQAEAYQILQKMNRINNGNDSPLEPFELYEEWFSQRYKKKYFVKITIDFEFVFQI